MKWKIYSPASSLYDNYDYCFSIYLIFEEKQNDWIRLHISTEELTKETDRIKGFLSEWTNNDYLILGSNVWPIKIEIHIVKSDYKNIKMLLPLIQP